MKEKNDAVLMDVDTVRRTLVRIAHEIVEKNKGALQIALVGIHTRGVPMAHRLAKIIQKVENTRVPVGSLDITLYRDDLQERFWKPVVQKTEIPFSVEDKVIVLVDEVIFTGRTIRAAMDALIDLGRPDAIQLAVLVDRGHREVPIRPDYVGKNIPTSKREEVKVSLKEMDGEDKVELIKLEKLYRKK